MNGDSYSRGKSTPLQLQCFIALTEQDGGRHGGSSRDYQVRSIAPLNRRNRSSMLTSTSHPDATATIDAAATAQAEATAREGQADDDPAHHTTATDRAATTPTPTHTLPADVTRSANARIDTAGGTGGQTASGTAIAAAATAADAAGDGATTTGLTGGADAICSTTAAGVVEGEMAAAAGDGEVATISSRRCAVRRGAGPRRLARRRSASLRPI